MQVSLVKVAHSEAGIWVVRQPNYSMGETGVSGETTERRASEQVAPRRVMVAAVAAAVLVIVVIAVVV